MENALESGQVSMTVGAPCGLALLPVGVYATLWAEGHVGTRAGHVAVREQSVSLIGPPRPLSTIALLCPSLLLRHGSIT